MKIKNLFISGLFVLIFSLQLQSAQTERVLTLQDSINFGLKNSQDLLASNEDIEVAKLRVDEARSNIFPRIDLNFNASQFDNQFPTVLAPSFNSLYLPGGKNDQYYSAKATMWQYLYAGGRYSTTLDLAKANLAQYVGQYESAKIKALKEIKIAFIDLLASNKKIKTYEFTINEINNNLSKHYSSEMVVLKDKLARNLLTLKHKYEKDKITYLKTIGLELDTTFDIAGELENASTDYDVNKCIALAYQFRPELNQKQFQEKIDALRLNLSLTERFPTISLGANYEWGGYQFPLDYDNWNATINFNWPIFDGWAALSRIVQRKHQIRQGKIRRAQIEDNVELEVRDALIDYNFWKSEREKAITQRMPTQIEAAMLYNIFTIDISCNLLKSKTMLEWAIGKPLDQINK
ncbi:MAG: TolC family protein [Endomicrobiales bacterium]|nr:TolC family protein [Endomicrobiales bacterium]